MPVSLLRRMFSKMCPKLRQAHSVRDVLTMYDKGAFKDAYSSLRNVMENQPSWSKHGDVYILWADLELLANHDPHKALELLDIARDVGFADTAYYYAKRAEALWETGDRELALQCYEKSLAADPCAFYRSNLARALSFLDDERALGVWQQVLEEDPKNCLAHTYIGWEAAKAGDRDKGLLMAKKAEELQSSTRDILEIARLYYVLEEFQSAINKYLEAKKLGYDEEGPLYAAIADCYLSLGDARAARKYVERAVRCDPEDDYVKDVWQEFEELRGEEQ